MSDLTRAANPELSALEFKELLDLQDIDVYETLDLNESASQRYMDYLATQPEIEYLPSRGDFNTETLQKANAGDHLAQFSMAVECTDNNDLVGQSEWFRKSAENGNILASFNYALTLSEPSKQLPWFYKAAYKGVPEAQREVGRILYQQGDSVTARKWFGLAIRRGSAMALNDMGIMCWDEENSTEAVEYWRQAAELGNEDAVTNIEMASTETLFDEDFDLDFNDSNTYTPPSSSYQPPPVQVVESTKRTGFEIL